MFGVRIAPILSLLIGAVSFFVFSTPAVHAQTATAGAWVYVSNDIPTVCQYQPSFPIYLTSGFYNVKQIAPAVTIFSPNGYNNCHLYLHVVVNPNQYYTLTWWDGTQSEYMGSNDFGFDNENGDPAMELYDVPSSITFLQGTTTPKTATSTTPSLLTLAAVPSGSHAINLSWHLTGNSTPISYAVFRSTTAAGLSGVLYPGYATIKNISGSETTYTDTSLAASTTYYYTLMAMWNVDSNHPYGGWSPRTNIAAAETAPEQLTDLTATMAMTTAQQGINLSWKNTATNATAVDVERGNDGTSFSSIATLGPKVTSYSDSLANVANTLSLTGIKDYYRVRAELSNGTYTPYSNVASTSNCVLVSGTGVDKIVFMRGSMWNGTDADFLSTVNSVISSGFQSIDPFKSFFSDFSFYLDLQSINEASLSPGRPDPTNLNPVNVPYLEHDSTIVHTIESQSSCGSNNFEYIFISGDPQEYSAYSFLGTGFVFFDIQTEQEWALNIALSNNASATDDVSYSLGPTIVHESGHAIGYLDDEYVNPGVSAVSADDANTAVANTNCTLYPDTYYHSSITNLLYGSTTLTGCTYSYTMTTPPQYYYRPSDTSIMDWPDDDAKFNVISCGYVLAAILGKAPSETNAQTYWPPCMYLDTVDGISSGADAVPAAHPGPAPVVSTISPPESNGDYEPGDPTITGTNFTPTGNSVQLTSVSNPSQVYVYDDLPSSDNGTELAFIISTSTPSGTYTVQVGSFNSNWSSPLPTPITIVNSSIPVLPTTYGLSVAVTGGGTGSVTDNTGGINCSTGGIGICNASYVPKTAVILDESPASGSKFTGWSGACSGVSISCSVAMNKVKSVTASFTPVATAASPSGTAVSGSNTLTVTASYACCGMSASAVPSIFLSYKGMPVIEPSEEGSFSQSFPPGTAVTLSVSISSGSGVQFAGWSGACSGTGTCTVTMNADQSVTASYESTAVSNIQPSVPVANPITGIITPSVSGTVVPPVSTPTASLVPVRTTPSIASISPASATISPAQTVVITGTNFTSNDAILLTPAGQSVPVAVILTSGSATSLSFNTGGSFRTYTLPSSGPSLPSQSWVPQPGSYTLSVGTISPSGLAVSISNSLPFTFAGGSTAVPPVTPAAPAVSAASTGGVTAINHAQNPDTSQGLIYVSWPSQGSGYTYTVSASPSYAGSVETTTGTGINMGCYSLGCFNGGGPFPGNGPYTFTVTATNGSGTVTVGTSNPETVSAVTSFLPQEAVTNFMANAWNAFVNYLW